jgi:aryl-phospho-beta-D-glucosidase BglC (GH1 family)
MRVHPDFGFRLVSLSLAAAPLALAGCFADPQPTVAAAPPAPNTPGQPGPQGCAVSSGTPSFAPGGYYTNGAQVCTSKGERHVFHGVDRPSLEWGSGGDNITPDDFQTMASWHANVVRIALNQDFWLSDAYLYDSNYAATVAQAVTWAEEAGLDVILDLHWSDQGNINVMQAGGTLPNDPTKYVSNDTAGYSLQQPMADANSLKFWSQVATTFAGDGHVLFELYNEPNNISWGVWLNGGATRGFTAVGMQALYDAVRATGAQNLVIVGGTNWAFDLSGVAANRINGYNIMYASHPYRSNDTQAQWAGAFGYLAAQNIAPVIITEFGDNRPKVCTGDWDQALIDYAAADTLQISWTAWAWYPGDPCTFPALITDWGGDTTAAGQVVKDALAKDPAPTPWIQPPVEDAGTADASHDGGAVGDATTDGAAEDAAASDASDAGVDAGDASSDATSGDGQAADATGD